MNSTSESDADLRTQVRQQEVIAELGQQALETDDLEGLMHDAAVAVTNTLDNEYTKVLELLPDDDIHLRHGVGWRDGLVGSTTISIDHDSQAGYTLRTEQPVVVEDLRTEDRFSGPELLTSHDVVSGISVVIGSVEEPWGVLGTHTSERREFTDHDVNFVQSVANVLASAIENERERRELEESYGRITDACYVLDGDWTFTRVDDRTEAMIDPGGDGLIGKNVWEEFEWTADSKLRDEYERAMETQEPTTFERYCPEPLDGWYEVHAVPSETALSVYLRDITEQKYREQRLEERERQLSTLMNNVPGMVYRCRSERGWPMTFVSDACREVTGYEPDALERGDVGWGEDVMVQEDREALWETVHENVVDGGTFSDTYRIETADGERRWVRDYGRGIFDESGELVDIEGIISDITEHKEIRRQLEESERRYRTLAENFPNGAVGVYDDDLRYTLATGRILGDRLPSADRLEGSRVSEVFSAEPAADLEALYRAALDGETDNITIEHGDYVWRVWAAPLRDADGEIFAGLAFTQDVTEQAERKRRLEEVVEELSESNERLEQFAYAASHDLQEPLRMVSSYLRLIEDRYADELDADGEEFLEFAVDGADRMREMIEGLLEYSRVDTQGEPLEPIELDDVLENVLDNLQVKIDEHDAEITADSLPRVRGDGSQLQQLFQNLLSNAIEYAGDEPPRIHVGAEREGRLWKLWVRDDGIGIDADDADRVFEVFQRLHSREEQAGTGIGLALCQRIVERHGGEIWVDSEPGEGSTFSFLLQPAGADE